VIPNSIRAQLPCLVLGCLLVAAFVQWVVRLDGDGRKPLSALSAQGEPLTYPDHIRPLLDQYCFGCHGEKQRGGLDLRPYRESADVRRDRPVFESVLRHLHGGLMPPENRPQPATSERQQLVAWLESELFFCDCRQPDPGQVTVRRLNRTEYNHTMRDLVGVDVRPADEFPADDTGYGFDNIGDVLSLPPVLFEKYLAAAGKVLDRAIATNTAAPPPSHTRIFFTQPSAPTPAARLEAAQGIVQRFATRAFRRPVTAEETERLLDFYRAAATDGATFEASVKAALHAVLVSPQLLFRGEPQPATGARPANVFIDEFALASRLSYFLWSSMPDDELFALASAGQLRRHLAAQVRRMLRHEHATALVENFAGQWLELRKLDEMTPDATEFPAFNPALRTAMRRETELFFTRLLREDRSVLECLDARWTYANAALARHYGLPEVAGEDLQLVSLEGTPRGGLLTHASILTLTSNPTRTSPVKRGKWVLDNLLGTPPPPPAPDVPPLDESNQSKLTGSLRQRMEQHRADPLCASCHTLMDPIGFAFENYDGIGAWRTEDGGFPIDPAGTLASGESFQGPEELRRILMTTRRTEFVRCLSSKLLTYALGRGLEYYDRCALDEITGALAKQQYRFSALILAVVDSVPFQMQRGAGEQRQDARGARR